MAVRITVNARTATPADGAGEALHLDQEVITIGRDPSCEVVLSDPSVSRSHARIMREGTLFFLEDLGSTSGTKLNGLSLRRGERSLLHDGDGIAIAHFELSFSVPTETPRPVDESTSFLARQAVREVVRGISAADGPHLKIMTGPRAGERVALGHVEELIIGRDGAAHVILDGDLVSRRHARLRRDWNGAHIEDLGSRNGVRVNRKRVEREALADRDEIEIGGVRMLFIDPTATRHVSLRLVDADAADEGTAAVAVASGESPDAPAPEPGLPRAGDAAVTPESRPTAFRFIPLAVAALCAAVALVFLALVAAGL